jgi:biopolymer transport protein ExbB/TolQ
MNVSFTRQSAFSSWRLWLLWAAFIGFLALGSRAEAQQPDGLPAANGAPAAGAPAVENAEQNSPRQGMGIPNTWRRMIYEVGWLWWAPFLVATFIAICFGIERLVVLRRGRVIPRAFVDRFLQHLEQNQLDQDSALELCESNHSPVASVFAHGVRKWGKPSVEVEQAIIDGGERQVSQLRKHLRVLNGVSTVTPLMGLLGTVVGMILAFNELANLYPLPSYLGLTLTPQGQVQNVAPGSIANIAGVEAGSAVTKVNGAPANDIARINKALDSVTDTAGSVKIAATQNGTEKEYELTLKQNWKQEATDKSFRLANGIGVALLTTVFGLVIAIPSLILYMYLAGRVDSLVMEMDLLAQDVVHLISMEALAKDPASPTRARSSTRRPTATTKKKAV